MPEEGRGRRGGWGTHTCTSVPHLRPCHPDGCCGAPGQTHRAGGRSRHRPPQWAPGGSTCSPRLWRTCPGQNGCKSTRAPFHQWCPPGAGTSPQRKTQPPGRPTPHGDTLGSKERAAARTLVYPASVSTMHRCSAASASHKHTSTQTRREKRPQNCNYYYYAIAAAVARLTRRAGPPTAAMTAGRRTHAWPLVPVLTHVLPIPAHHPSPAA
jgi:hypothetical protein